MIKRALAAALCLMLVFALLPRTAQAGTIDKTLYFDGTNLKLGNSTAPYVAETGSWSGSGNTLTLNDFEFTTSAATALVLPSGTTLVLNGTNSVMSTLNNFSGASCGIKCNGGLTIKDGGSGTGTLTATGGGSPSHPTNTSYGVWVEGAAASITVESGNITGMGGETIGEDAKSYGVHSEGSITVDGGSIAGTGGLTTGSNSDSYSYGVYSEGSITVDGGSIAGTGGKTTGDSNDSYGVYSEISITVDNGSITGTGGETTGDFGESYGVYAADGNIAASGGSITGTGGTSGKARTTSGKSCGVRTEKGNITASGGSITGTGGEATVNSYGVHTEGMITASGGSITGTGGVADANSYGVLSSAQDVAVESGSITGTGGEASVSIGILAPGAIQLTGGRLVGESTATGGSAMNQQPSAPSSDPYYWRTGKSALYTASASASLPADFKDGAYADIRTGLPITFTVQPADTTVTEGSITGSLSAAVSVSPSGTATLNWYACDASGTPTGTSLGTGGSFTIPTDLTAGTHYYLCQAEYTDVKQNSTVATVTVNPPAPTVYQITQGQHSRWIKGSVDGLSFTANGDYSKFTGVSVDGNVIDNSNYTSRSGSTIVTLNAAYLETLPAGRHTLRINFTDGYAETNFFVNVAGDAGDVGADVPKTGDAATPMLWLGLMLLAGAGLAVSAVRRRRRNG